MKSKLILLILMIVTLTVSACEEGNLGGNAASMQLNVPDRDREVVDPIPQPIDVMPDLLVESSNAGGNGDTADVVFVIANHGTAPARASSATFVNLNTPDVPARTFDVPSLIISGEYELRIEDAGVEIGSNTFMLVLDSNGEIEESDEDNNIGRLTIELVGEGNTSTHATCHNLQCVITTGPGEDECSVDADCVIPEYQMDLAYFPEIFRTNLGDLDAEIVVGEASTLSVVALAAQTAAIVSSDFPSDVGARANEVDFSDPHKVISLDGPCANSFAAMIKGNPEDCTEGVPQGYGVISLYDWEGEPVLLVEGYSLQDLQNAVRVLQDYDNFELHGDKICVQGDENDLTVSPCPVEQPLPALDLFHFPYPFVSNGDIRTKFVIGEHTQLPDIVYLSNFIAAISDTEELDTDGLVMRDWQIDYDEPQMLISIDLVCNNAFAAFMYDNPEDCTEFETPGQGHIRATWWENNPVLLITGYTVEDMRNALEVMTNWEDYSGLRGREICVERVDDETLVLAECGSPSLPEDEVCWDPDGLDYYRKGKTGYTHDGNIVTAFDSCVTITSCNPGTPGCYHGSLVQEVSRCEGADCFVSEKYCSGDFNIGAENHACDCGNGACVEEYDGYLIEGDEKLNFRDSIWDVKETLTEDELPGVLMSGTLENYGMEYDYVQEAKVLDGIVSFGQDDDYDEDPVVYLDIGNMNMEYSVFFDDEVDFTRETDGVYEFFGKPFRFTTADNSGLTLLASNLAVVVNYGEPVVVESNGVEYTIEVLGHNNETSEIILRVTGQGVETKTLAAGESVTMAGLLIYVEDIFISNIGEERYAASLLIGGEEWEIPIEAFNTQGQYYEVEINGDNSELLAHAEGGVTYAESLQFKVYANSLVDDNINDEYQWLPQGRTFEEPYFDWTLQFPAQYIASKANVEMGVNGDSLWLEFENFIGEDYDVTLFENDGGLLVTDFVFDSTTVEEGDLFIDNSNGPSRAYLVKDVDDDQVSFQSLGDGSTRTFEVGESLGDLTILSIVNGVVTFDEATEEHIMAGNLKLEPYVNDMGEFVNMRFTESYANVDEQDWSTLEFSAHAYADTIRVQASGWIDSIGQSGMTATDDDGDFRDYMSEYGSVLRVWTDGHGLVVFYPEEESAFDVYVNMPGYRDVIIIDPDPIKPPIDEPEMQDDAQMERVRTTQQTTAQTQEEVQEQTQDKRVVPQTPSTSNVQEPKEDNPEANDCGGCFYEDQCFETSHRVTIDGGLMYCSAAGDFEPQKARGNVCAENYECKDARCVDNTCGQKTLWEQMLRFFGVA